MADEPRFSVYDLPPLETGGSRSRQGLAFQDHVTVGFCLDMLSDFRLIEVWCETQDDVTLIWKADQICVEFVQAKSDEFDQLWSISRIAQREGGKVGSSILERSLAYDRCAEAALFRLVAVRPFNSDLEVLTLQRDSEARLAAREAVESIQADFFKRIGDGASENGNNCREWTRRVLLDARHSEDAVIAANLRKLQPALEALGFYPLYGQLEEIYSQLAAVLAKAAALDARVNRAEKRFPKERFLQIVVEISTRYLRQPIPEGGKVLKEKLTAAKIPDDTIEGAQELRRSYRQKSLNPIYYNVQDRPLLDSEVAAILQTLKAQLDSGAIEDQGPEFFNRCLQTLTQFRETFPAEARPPLADVFGSMYVIADRCLHRFRRASA